MARLTILLLLLILGCRSEYEEKYGETESEYERRIAACVELEDSGGYSLSFARTDLWQVGKSSYWSTPADIGAALGPPDTTYHELDEIPEFRISELESFVWERTGEGLDGSIVFEVLADTLAYPKLVELITSPLATDRGLFEPGASLSEVGAAFPESYQCRDYPPALRDYRERFDSGLMVNDSVRQANVVLLFRGGGLAAVGTRYYAEAAKHRLLP
ncbi:MAG: hypothetical protein AAF845_13040 [Bacteroidota bacterium]